MKMIKASQCTFCNYFLAVYVMCSHNFSQHRYASRQHNSKVRDFDSRPFSFLFFFFLPLLMRVHCHSHAHAFDGRPCRMAVLHRALMYATVFTGIYIFHFCYFLKSERGDSGLLSCAPNCLTTLPLCPMYAVCSLSCEERIHHRFR